MLKVHYKPSFIRQLKNLEADLVNESLEKIELLKNIKNHKSLKIHKLHGKLKNIWSFSVNYKYRIVFEYEAKNNVTLLAIGDHDVYK